MIYIDPQLSLTDIMTCFGHLHMSVLVKVGHLHVV